MVSEIAKRGTAPRTITTQPAPPPRSTHLQQSHIQTQLEDPVSLLPSSASLPSSTSLEEVNQLGVWGSASSGGTSANSYSLPTAQITSRESPNNLQDIPNLVSDMTTSVNGASATAGPEHNPTAAARSSPNTSPFDDVISFSTFHPAPSSQEESAKVAVPHTPVPHTPVPHTPQPPEESLPQPSPDEQEKQSVVGSTDINDEPGSQPHNKQRVPPPVPVRGSSVLQMAPEPAQGNNKEGEEEELTKTASESTPENTSAAESSGAGSLGSEELSEARRKLKRLPSLLERKRRLAAQMNAGGGPQSQSSGEKPGRVVINEALGSVSAGVPGTQHPLLLKKQEEAAARAREVRKREEQERLAREKKEKEERERISRRFPFKRSGKGKKDEKGKKDQKNRQSMTETERDELQGVFQRVIKSRPTGPEPTSSNPLVTVGETQPELQPSPVEKKEEEGKEVVDGGKFEEEVTVSVVPNAQHTPPPPSCQPPPPPPPRSGNSSRSSTLDRTTKPPPSSSPPSLPGSIDRRTWQGSKLGSLERTSRPGSRPGTLERKNPPPAPTSHPPPVPEDVRKEIQSTRSQHRGHGFSGGRMDLADLIPGVPRKALTEQPPPPPPPSSSSSTSPPRQYTVTNGPANPGPINAKRMSVKDRRSSSKRSHF